MFVYIYKIVTKQRKVGIFDRLTHHLVEVGLRCEGFGCQGSTGGRRGGGGLSDGGGCGRLSFHVIVSLASRWRFRVVSACSRAVRVWIPSIHRATGCWFGNGPSGGRTHVTIIIRIPGCISCKTTKKKIVNPHYRVLEKKIAYMWNLVLTEIYIPIKNSKNKTVMTRTERYWIADFGLSTLTFAQTDHSGNQHHG